MAFNEINASIYHISRKDKPIVDFISKNPIACTNEKCRICKFLSIESEITVKLLKTENSISNNFKMPFTNHVSCETLKRRTMIFVEFIPIYPLDPDLVKRKKIKTRRSF